MSALANRNYLFVCAPPRSGTTALVRCLNFHPKIVVGQERYKYRLLGRQCPTFDYRGLFAKERFFHFDPGDSNIDLKARFYVNAAAKYDAAKYVGDKVPRLYRSIPFLLRTFSPCRIVYIAREPISVAASWQRRADDPDDSWPAAAGYEQAIHEWNHALAAVCEFKERTMDEITVVRYAELFGRHGEEAFHALFRRLDLVDGIQQRSYRVCLTLIARYTANNRPAGLKAGVTAELLDHVARRADYDLYRRVCAFDAL